LLAEDATVDVTNTTIDDSMGGAGVVATASGTILNLIDSTVDGNSGGGIIVSRGAHATIQGGTINGNVGDGILLRADEPLVPGATAPATASIAEAGAPMTIADNTDDGIDIEPDGSSATINSANIVFSGNGDQDIEQ
jgi:hypothetical protein